MYAPGKNAWSTVVLLSAVLKPVPTNLESRKRYHLLRTWGKTRKPQTEYLTMLGQSILSLEESSPPRLL